MYCFGYALGVFSSYGIGYIYIGSESKTYEEVDGKARQRRIGTYRRHGMRAHISREVTYYSNVRSIKELLEYSRKGKR